MPPEDEKENTGKIGRPTFSRQFTAMRRRNARIKLQQVIYQNNKGRELWKKPLNGLVWSVFQIGK